LLGAGMPQDLKKLRAETFCAFSRISSVYAGQEHESWPVKMKFSLCHWLC
jgi:hypothetical protein